MVFSPADKTKIISHSFPAFTLDGRQLTFVNEFKYFGHYITEALKDDADIKREIRNLHIRTTMLIHRFVKCSHTVKVCLLRIYCICLYGVALWFKYSANTLLLLKLCYHKCIKMFFGNTKYHSVTDMLLELKLPSFDVMYNIVLFWIHRPRTVMSR